MEIIKRERFAHSARKVWSIARKFRRGSFQYALGTVVSTKSRDGEKFRTLSAVDGTKTVQKLVERNEDDMVIAIETVETTLPFGSWHSRLQITGDENEAEAVCVITIEPDGVSPETLQAMIDDAWMIGLASFKKSLDKR
ncbi:MAG: hypothetical protein ACR2OR_00225 [Hyphomicrobiales bacterium]